MALFASKSSQCTQGLPNWLVHYGENLSGQIRADRGLGEMRMSAIRRPESVASVVTFLASDMAENITGWKGIIGDRLSLIEDPVSRGFAKAAGRWTRLPKTGRRLLARTCVTWINRR